MLAAIQAGATSRKLQAKYIGNIAQCFDITILKLTNDPQVTYLYIALIVLQMFIDTYYHKNDKYNNSNDYNNERKNKIQMMIVVAPPPVKVLSDATVSIICVTHIHGLIKVYIAAMLCQWQEEQNTLPMEKEA